MARANLWWDQLRRSDGSVESSDLDAEGLAVASLARWRQGLSSESDILGLRSFIEVTPDGTVLGRIALAAALAENGRADDAAFELDRLMTDLETSAKFDFHDHQCLDLARAMRVVVLHRSGREDAARREAMALTSDLQEDLLPGILIREVIGNAPADRRRVSTDS